MIKLQPKIQNNIYSNSPVSFKKGNEAKNEVKDEPPKTRILAKEHSMFPVLTSIKTEKHKLKNAFTTYPQKGMTGSKNANFYEFLTMGKVPYLIGSAGLIAVFNLATKGYNNTTAMGWARETGKQMGIGVVLYGIAKTLSKKLIELPVKHKFGIDVNLPYEEIKNEIPEDRNKNNLIAKEYHKVYESVDFPRWDLLYDEKYYGEERNAYFDKIAKKMKIATPDMEHADQEVKPKIREKVIQTRLYSTLSSYLWAATAVGIASQDPFKHIKINPKERISNFATAVKKVVTQKTAEGKHIKELKTALQETLNNRTVDAGDKEKVYELVKNIKQSKKDAPILTLSKTGEKICNFVEKQKQNIFRKQNKEYIRKTVKYEGGGSLDGRFLEDFCHRFKESCKNFVGKNGKTPKATATAGKILLGSAIAVTLIGNFVTLFDFNKDKGSKRIGASPLIDQNKEKVVC